MHRNASKTELVPSAKVNRTIATNIDRISGEVLDVRKNSQLKSSCALWGETERFYVHRHVIGRFIEGSGLYKAVDTVLRGERPHLATAGR